MVVRVEDGPIHLSVRPHAFGFGGVQPGLQDSCRSVTFEFVVGQQPQYGLVAVGRGKGGCGRLQPVRGVVLVADPGEFEWVLRGECLGDRGAWGVRVAGKGGQRGDPPVLVRPDRFGASNTRAVGLGVEFTDVERIQIEL